MLRIKSFASLFGENQDQTIYESNQKIGLPLITRHYKLIFSFGVLFEKTSICILAYK